MVVLGLTLYLVQTLQYFKKPLPTKSWKNHSQKLLIIGSNLLFHSPAQPTANSPKSIFHIIKMSHQASVLLFVKPMDAWPCTMDGRRKKTVHSVQVTNFVLDRLLFFSLHFYLDKMRLNKCTFVYETICF